MPSFSRCRFQNKENPRYRNPFRLVVMASHSYMVVRLDHGTAVPRLSDIPSHDNGHPLKSIISTLSLVLSLPITRFPLQHFLRSRFRFRFRSTHRSDRDHLIQPAHSSDEIADTYTQTRLFDRERPRCDPSRAFSVSVLATADRCSMRHMHLQKIPEGDVLAAAFSPNTQCPPLWPISASYTVRSLRFQPRQSAHIQTPHPDYPDSDSALTLFFSSPHSSTTPCPSSHSMTDAHRLLLRLVWRPRRRQSMSQTRRPSNRQSYPSWSIPAHDASLSVSATGHPRSYLSSLCEILDSRCLIRLQVTYPKSALGESAAPYPLAIISGGFLIKSEQYVSYADGLASQG